MRGYRTVEGTYYESTSGPLHPSDVEIPLQPSDIYRYDEDKRTWRTDHDGMPHNYPREGVESVSVALTETKLLSIRDALYLVGIIGSAAAVYFGIIADVRTTKLEVDTLKTIVMEHQATSTNELRECNGRIRDLELQNARAGKQ
jgi:hypothetical protein